MDDALHRELFSEASLASVDKEAHHVFCATDLLTGRHGYLSPRLIYSYDWGLGTPSPSLRLSTAVQASACFPGGFPPRRLSAGDLSTAPLNVPQVELIDGGVYDNMGDEWEFGWDEREGMLGADLRLRQGQPAGTLVVVNAGGVWRSSTLPSWGVRREISALSKCSGIQHAITTILRRRFLVRQFGTAADGDLMGVLVHIDQSPYRVPTKFKGSDRAEAAIAFLGRLQLSPDDGEALRDDSIRVATVLSPIEPDRAARLMWHGYLLTRINAHVVLGLGTIPADDGGDDWSLARFSTLIAES